MDVRACLRVCVFVRECHAPRCIRNLITTFFLLLAAEVTSAHNQGKAHIQKLQAKIREKEKELDLISQNNGMGLRQRYTDTIMSQEKVIAHLESILKETVDHSGKLESQLKSVTHELQYNRKMNRELEKQMTANMFKPLKSDDFSGAAKAADAGASVADDEVCSVFLC